MSTIAEILRGVASGAGVVGAGLAGYGKDQELGAARVLAEAKQAEEARRNAVLNQVALAGVNPDIQGRLAGAKAQAEVQPHIDQAVGVEQGTAPIKVKTAVDQANQLAPIRTQEAIATAEGLAPIQQKTHAMDAEASAAAAERHAPPIAVANKDGSQTLVTRADAVGQQRAVTGGSGGGGGFGAGGIGGAGRTIAAINGLHNAHQGMTGYEEKVRNKTASFDGIDYWKNTVAQMYDAHGIKDKAVHATVMANLGKTNPDLANYIQNAEMWALEESSIPGSRPSDFRTKLDAFVSSLKPNASTEMINSIQRGRTSRLEGYDASVPALKAQLARIGGSTGGASHDATREQQLWDAAVAKYGQAKVLQEYGPRPPE